LTKYLVTFITEIMGRRFEGSRNQRKENPHLLRNIYRIDDSGLVEVFPAGIDRDRYVQILESLSEEELIKLNCELLMKIVSASKNKLKLEFVDASSGKRRYKK
jgi:hypothetical protein